MMRYVLNSLESESVHEVFENLMKRIWDCVAEPILQYLGFDATPTDGARWPRICWILGGLFSQLPIHAAGDYRRSRETGQLCTVLDRVISSYSPTFKALIHAFERNQILDNADAPEQPLAVIVGMSKTPGLSEKDQLAEVKRETDSIKSHIENLMATEVLMHPTRNVVLSKLEHCSIAHFACHAVSDTRDPSKSLLLLTDWKRSPLNYRSLSKTWLRNCRLAYLSACETAQHNNIELLDESVHLAGGVQLAGVPSVVGTLWKINDLETSLVVDKFYELLTTNSVIEWDRSAEALHRSIRHRRDQGAKPLDWGAYVHYGV